MTKSLLPIARFPLPDEWEVEDTMCVKIRIPNDQQYLGVLIGLLDALKWSENFARDPTKTGASIVSRTWQKAIESVPIETEGCDMPDFRIDPDTCVLEFDCGDGNWRPVFTPEYDPRNREGQPTYPDPPPEGQSNECLAAANVAEYIWWAGEKYAIALAGESVFMELVNLGVTVISMLFTLAVEIIIGETTQLAAYVDEENILTDWAALDKQAFIDLMTCYYDDEGVFMSGNYDSLLTWLTSQAEINQAWGIVRFMIILMGFGGLTIAGVLGGISEAECASCGEACHDFVGSGGMQGFAFFENANGEYGLQDGTGWYGKQFSPPSFALHRVLYMYQEVSPSLHTTNVRLTIDNASNVSGGLTDARVGFYIGETYLESDPQSLVNGSHIYTFNINAAIDSLYIQVRSDGTDVVYLTNIEWCFIGSDDPF